MRAWVDRHQVGHLSVITTADDLARVMNETDRRADDITVDAIRGGWFESRGHTVAGERCEIPGFGPVPVSLARRMSEDAILKVIVTRGVDVVGVAYGGRTIPAHFRSALKIRDSKCIVPRCDVRRNLEIDHRNTWSRTQVTKLDDLARLCPWHHHQKTFLGYTYRGGPGTWQWIPPENRDEDLTALRRIITCARRC